MTKAAAAKAETSTEGAGEGAAPEAGGKKETNKAGIAEPHDESTPGDRGEEQPKLKDRPEYAPEEYWDAEKGELKIEDLAKGYLETKKKVTMRTGDLEKKVKEEFEQSRMAGRPESPDKYELKLPENIPAEAWEWNEEDPRLKFVREMAFNEGWGQDKFDQLIGAYVQGEIESLPDIDKETKRLGEKGKERVERIDNWLSANVSSGAYAALSSVATKAEVVIAIEELMQKAGAPAFAIDTNDHGGQDVLTDNLVKTWMADPKYWDPQKRDPSFVDKVDKAWRKLYPSKK